MFMRNSNPYFNSRVDCEVRNIVRGLGVACNDYLIMEPYSIGDAYHTLCLLSQFRRNYPNPGGKLYFVCNQRAVPLTHMFEGVDHVVAFNGAPNEFMLESIVNRHNLNVGEPIVTAPDMYANGWLAQLSAKGLISPLHGKKLILGLDLDAPVVHGVVPSIDREKAAHFAREHGVIFGKSLIIFNHANTINSLPNEVFSDVVDLFGGNVFTDTGWGKVLPLSGTVPLNIPLDLVVPLSEIAGYVLALRSGITDILSSAKIKLMSLYPRGIEIKFSQDVPVEDSALSFRYMTLNKLGLSPKCHEIPIFLENSDDDYIVRQKISDIIKTVCI